MNWQFLADIAYTFDSTNTAFTPNRIKARQQHELVDHINAINAIRIWVPSNTFQVAVQKPSKKVKRNSAWSTIASVLEPGMVNKMKTGFKTVIPNNVISFLLLSNLRLVLGIIKNLLTSNWTDLANMNNFCKKVLHVIIIFFLT